jgi:exopolysaccharide production protein ExoY
MSMQRGQALPVVTVRWDSSRAGASEKFGGQQFALKADSLADRLPLWKRCVDFCVIGVTLPFILPISAILAIYIKLVSPGPVLFTQERVGFRCRRFRVFKFRTMHVGVGTGVHQNHLDQLIGGDKPMTKLDHVDKRLIPLAKWIRASGLDELPQLVNVLRGEMSVVGPRPCTDYEFAKYQDWHKQRFNAFPGLTGLWQVSGKNNTTFNEMIQLDVAYGQQQSIWLDLYIIFKTFPALCQQVYESKCKRGNQAASANASTTTTSLTTTTTTTNSNTGGYEQRTESRSCRMRVLGS